MTPAHGRLCERGKRFTPSRNTAVTFHGSRIERRGDVRGVPRARGDAVQSHNLIGIAQRKGVEDASTVDARSAQRLDRLESRAHLSENIRSAPQEVTWISKRYRSRR